MASAYFNLGVTFAGTKQFDTALQCFERAEHFEPGQLEFLEASGLMPGRIGTMLSIPPDGTATVRVDGTPVGVGSATVSRNIGASIIPAMPTAKNA